MATFPYRVVPRRIVSFELRVRKSVRDITSFVPEKPVSYFPLRKWKFIARPTHRVILFRSLVLVDALQWPQYNAPYARTWPSIILLAIRRRLSISADGLGTATCNRSTKAACVSVHCYRNVKVKLPPCLTKHHAMKTYWGSGGIAPRIL
jgi:hypothetical protein